MSPLVKPEFSQDQSQEVVLEKQILVELGALRGQVKDLRTVLMGSGEDGETKFGRLPMVENKLDGHELRLAALEAKTARLDLYRDGASGVGRWLSGVLGLVLGAVLGALILKAMGQH
jgi:hypothetical protein